MHTRPHRRPRTQVPKSRVCKLRTAYLGAALCKRAQRQPNANSKLLDGCSTDPEPDMEKRQAFFRNMRSKCRCSCVLQFTRHHGVSSVLHRPPSQMIHCIVLCFQFSDLRPKTRLSRDEQRYWLAALPNVGGDHKPGPRRALFEPLDIPQLSSVRERSTVPRQRGPSSFGRLVANVQVP